MRVRALVRGKATAGPPASELVLFASSRLRASRLRVTRSMRHVVVGGSVLAIAALGQPSLPAHADTYRFWSYWVGGDSWTYSASEFDFRVPADRGVEGWRFVVSPSDGTQAVPPATASTYDQLCPGQQPAPVGQKRVAVVIDPGSTGIAPLGESPPERTITCLTVPAPETGLQVLQRRAQLRLNSSGLICGIDGFPAAECPGQTVPRTTSPQPTGVPPPDSATAPLPSEDAETSSSSRRSGTATPTPTAPSWTPAPTGIPSPLALTLPESRSPGPEPEAPAWVTAIGVTMLAALLGLAILVRKGRG